MNNTDERISQASKNVVRTGKGKDVVPDITQFVHFDQEPFLATAKLCLGVVNNVPLRGLSVSGPDSFI